MRSIQALGLGSFLRLGDGLGMLSCPPGTKLGRHFVGVMNSSRNQGVSLQPGNLGAGGGGAPDVGAVESVVGGGGAVDVGAMASVVGVTGVGVSFQKPRLRARDDERALRGRGGDCSGELSLELRSAPHPQT